MTSDPHETAPSAAGPTPSSWLAQRARISPSQVALIFRGEEISFAALFERTCERARQLRELGVRDGDRVAVLLSNGPLFVELLHAMSLCHATLLPLNARLTAEEIAFQLRDTEACLLVHGGGSLETVALEAIALLPDPIRSAQDSPRAQLLEDRPAPAELSAGSAATAHPLHTEIDEDRLLALLYTSGTSGKPKAVPLSHRAFRASAMSSARNLGVSPSERWLACLPLFHIGGLSILTRSVLSGATVLLQDGFDAQAVSRAIDEEGVTLTSLVPTMLKRVLDLRGDTPMPDSLRGVLLGGGPIPEALLQRAKELHVPVLSTYGLTEACSQVATQPVGEGTPGMKPLLDVELRIVDESGDDLPPDTEGEILLRGPMVMQGYWNRPEDNAKTLRGGWLHTGDIGALDSTGSLRVFNRRSDLILSGGENVYPAEVEATLQAHPEIHEAGVCGEPDAELGELVAAWVVREPETHVSEEEIQTFCRAHLAGYKIPRWIYVMESLPRTASGKLLRRELSDRPEASRSSQG